jgi:hypothetical protein
VAHASSFTSINPIVLKPAFSTPRASPPAPQTVQWLYTSFTSLFPMDVLSILNLKHSNEIKESIFLNFS